MKLRFRREALADLEKIFDYIAEEDQVVAFTVVRRIRNACLRLERFPHSGRQGAVPGTHELVIPRLPYIVVYEISELHVDIIGVFHGAQDRG